jgi:hypothetical protein
LEDKITQKLDEIFNGLAIPTIESQKKLLGIHGKLSREDGLKMAERIRELFVNLVGEVVADKVYKELVEIIKSEID